MTRESNRFEPNRVVGLTGGIASGKSTVSKIMAENGAVVIDADAIAHEVVQKSKPAWREIRDHFGLDVLRADEEIDRSRLGDIVFKNPQARSTLEAIVHPRVHDETQRRIRQAGLHTPNAVVVLDVPLLFEVGMDKSLSVIIVVYVPESVQLSRLMKRDGISRESAMDRIQSQMSLEEKKNRATHIIDNSGPISNTRDQVLAMMAELRKNIR